MSTPLWSRALADVLGSPLQAVDAERAQAWIDQGLRENEQLDFKAELYGNTDSARRELAGDLAAFANHRGGLLALGVDEDEQGAASALALVELSDEEERRIQQIVAGNVFPHLPVEIFPVSVGDDGRGVLILAVAPSPLRPHAVAVNEGLRYPRRQGTVTRYLSESEVADLYRDRFAVQRSEVERVSEIRREAITEINEDDAVWVAVAAVPTGKGGVTIDREQIDATATWANQFIGGDFVTGFLGQGAPLVRPGQRRFRLMTNYAYEAPPNYQYAELHLDGAGVAMHRLFTGRDAPAEGGPHPVINTSLVWTTAKTLNVVAAHAENSGAWGELAVEVTVFGQPRYLAWVAHGHFIEAIEGARAVDHDLVAHHTFDLADLRSGTQALLAATRALLMDIFNAFGSPEILFLAPTGALKTGFIDGELQRWAADRGVAVE